MKKTELKAYLSALRTTLPKRSQIPALRKVAKRGNSLIATDLETYCELDFATQLEDGIYEPYVLNLLAIDNHEATPDTELNLADYPELKINGWCKWNILTRDDINHIIEASECISKDETRPALATVALYDGLITGTDGYVLVSHPQSSSLDFGDTPVYLNKTVLTIFKKLHKYGKDWEIRVSKDGASVYLTNGTFGIASKNIIYGYPDVRKLLNENDHFTNVVQLDITTLLAMAGKDRDAIDIDMTTGEVKLGGEPTNVVAKICTDVLNRRSITYGRSVAMPMRAEDGHLALSLTFLKRLTKETSITLLTNNSQFGMIEVE